MVDHSSASLCPGKVGRGLVTSSRTLGLLFYEMGQECSRRSRTLRAWAQPCSRGTRNCHSESYFSLPQPSDWEWGSKVPQERHLDGQSLP